MKNFKTVILKAVADPDLSIRGTPGHPDPEIREGGPGLQKLFFGPLGLSLVLKQRKGGGPRILPLDAPLRSGRGCLREVVVYKSFQL